MSRQGFLEVDGFRLGYCVEGDGRPMLIPGSAVYYPRTFSEPLRRQCQCIFADMRHFAHTVDAEPRGPVTLETYMADFERFRREFGLERFALLGHSHHGNLALEYAKRFPQHVSHLIMVGSPPCDVETTLRASESYWNAYADPARKALLERNREALKQRGIAGPGTAGNFVAQYLADAPRYWYAPERDGAFLWDGVPINPEAFMAFRTFFASYVFDCAPERMNVPVLVIMGLHDYVVPHCLWGRATRETPLLSYHLFQRSGHTPQLEEPGLFDRTLLAFLEHNQTG